MTANTITPDDLSPGDIVKQRQTDKTLSPYARVAEVNRDARHIKFERFNELGNRKSRRAAKAKRK